MLQTIVVRGQIRVIQHQRAKSIDWPTTLLMPFPSLERLSVLSNLH